jgi:hypothetical protein
VKARGGVDGLGAWAGARRYGAAVEAVLGALAAHLDVVGLLALAG